MKRAEPERRQGLSHSFDMLGEAARTHADAARYAEAYARALDRIAKEAKDGFRSRRAFRSSCRRCIRATNGATATRPRRRCCRCCASWR
jgi:proline dehydrogenase